MPATDQCHDQVVRAFQRAGWQVAKPDASLYNHQADIVYIDLEAIHTSNGSGEYRHIFVEVKCFTPPINSRELQAAIGQYLIYRTVLASQQMAFDRYLAAPESGYNALNSVVRQVLSDNHIKLVVIQLNTERIVRWIE